MADAPNLEHLFSMTATTEVSAMIPNGPNGTRVIVRAESGTFEGPAIRGTIQGPGGDWVCVRPDGTMVLDVRLVLKTDDDALIYMTYAGIGKNGVLHTTPRFETSTEKYAYLNDAVCISHGAVGQGDVTYHVFRAV
jgi:Protein of unknown function (DUF3237)